MQRKYFQFESRRWISLLKSRESTFLSVLQLEITLTYFRKRIFSLRAVRINSNWAKNDFHAAPKICLFEINLLSKDFYGDRVLLGDLRIKEGDSIILGGKETHLDPEFLLKFPRLFNHTTPPFVLDPACSPFCFHPESCCPAAAAQLLPAKDQNNSYQSSVA